MNLSSKYIQEIKKNNDKVAIVSKGNSYTYTQLYNEIQSKRDTLVDNKIRKGDIVFIVGDYSFEAISLFLALLSNNNIIVPVTSEKEDEVNERIEVVKPDFIINLRNKKINKCYNRIQQRHSILDKVISSGVPGLILFSSGSTGKPKAMVHNLDAMVAQYLNRKQRDMNFLVFLMFDHIGGLNTLLSCLAMGARIILPDSRNPNDICKLIEKYQVHVLPTSPTFLNLILISEAYKKYDLSSLKLITYGTEPMPDSLLKRLLEVFNKVKFLQTFGTSETGIAKTSSQSSSSTYLKIDDADQEYKIVEGELWLRSKTQVLGYINHSNEKFTHDGWFKTGDLVEEKDGYLKIKGRNEEVINVGGEKVLPAEVESIIMEIPDVQDCIVKAGRNPITGQMVTAEIMLLDENINIKEIKRNIIQHCREMLDDYKVPAKISFVDSISFNKRFKKNRL